MKKELINFEDFVGKKVTLKGKVSNIMWQHFATPILDHPYTTYIDLDETHQIVAYSKEPIEKLEYIQFTGNIIKIDTQNNDPRSKICDGYVEYQIIIDTWKYI